MAEEQKVQDEAKYSVFWRCGWMIQIIEVDGENVEISCDRLNNFNVGHCIWCGQRREKNKHAFLKIKGDVVVDENGYGHSVKKKE